MVRKCKQCSSEIPTFAASKTPWEKEKLCSVECASTWGLNKARKEKAKQVQKAKRDAQAQAKAARQKSRSFKASDISTQLKLTQRVYNRWLKLEKFAAVAEPVCVSCGKPAYTHNLGQFACGHYKTVGAHPELRFNTLNTEIQCNHYCNMQLSGNISGNKHTAGYTAGLAKVYGDDSAGRRLNYLNRPHTDFTRDVKQLAIVRTWCNARIRILEKQLGIQNA